MSKSEFHVTDPVSPSSGPTRRVEPKILRPLRRRNFALLWTGMTVSFVGDGIYFIALAWQVYELSNAPTALSLVGLAWTGPLILLLLLGGLAGDRFERRKVMMLADALRGAAVAVAGLLSMAGMIQWLVSAGLVPISFALTGPVAEAIGSDATLVGAGAIGGTFMLLFLMWPGLRDTERDGSIHAASALVPQEDRTEALV